MIIKTKKTALSVIFLALFPLISLASTTYTPMEKIPGFESEGTDLASYILSIFKFGIWAIGISAMLMIIIGGIMYVTSAGNTSSIGKAKGVIQDAIIGLVMALSCYLILYVINPDLVKLNLPTIDDAVKDVTDQTMGVGDKSGSSSSGDQSGGGSGSSSSYDTVCCMSYDSSTSKYSCETTTGDKCTGIANSGKCSSAENSKKCSDMDAPITESSSSSSSNSSSASTDKNAGKCVAVSEGPCSSQNLKQYFGSGSDQASRICNRESGGNPAYESTTDKMKDGKSFSVGLMQVNLTQHSIGGLNCPSAFSGKNYSATIVNQSLYDQCVAAAKNPTTNLQYSSSLSKNGTSFSHWKDKNGSTCSS